MADASVFDAKECVHKRVKKLSFLFLRSEPENPSLRLAVQKGRIGKSGNFPKPSLGNLANFRELKPWFFLGFS
jgi:hypothetical protein